MNPPTKVAIRWNRKVADLNPPLGYPGGQCYVIERILSKNLGKKGDELVEIISMGGDIDGSSEKKSPLIYEKHMEKAILGTQFDWLGLTSHAQYRMDLRGVTVGDIKAALIGFQNEFAKEKSRNSPKWRAWQAQIQNSDELRWVDKRLGGLAIGFIVAKYGGKGAGAYVQTVFYENENSLKPINRNQCSPFENWVKKTPIPTQLEKIFEGKTGTLKSGPTPGIQTLVTDKSQDNLPTDIDREKETNLPPGSATPGSGGREIPRVEYNTPDSGSNISERPRTMGVPGEQYGSPYKEDYNMPTRRTMTAGTSCESEHSWAWITPEGKFIEVHDHGTWAMANMNESQKDRIRNHPYVKEFWKDQGFEYPELLEAIFTDEFGYPSGKAKGLATHLLGYLNPDIVDLAKNYPTLQKGWWYPKRDRLTKAEETFLGAFPGGFDFRPSIKETLKNKQKEDLWKRPQTLHSIVRGLAKEVLEEDGWVTVSNATSIGWGDKFPSQKQLDAFFREVLKCWKAKGIRPNPDKEKFVYSQGPQWREMENFTEALDELASKQVSEEFFEYFLSGPQGTDSYVERRGEEDAKAREEWYAQEQAKIKRVKNLPSRKFPEKPPQKRLPYRARLAQLLKDEGVV